MSEGKSQFEVNYSAFVCLLDKGYGPKALIDFLDFQHDCSLSLNIAMFMNDLFHFSFSNLKRILIVAAQFRSSEIK